MSQAKTTMTLFENRAIVIAQRDRAIATPAVAIVRGNRQVRFRVEKTGEPVTLLVAQPGGGSNARADCRFTARFACHWPFFEVDS